MEKSNPFQRWYSQNKASYNEKRRQRYHSDTEYRDRVLETSKRNRGQGKIPPELSLIGEAALQVGRDPYTIKSWELKGYVPIASKIGNVRVYTKHQISLLQRMAEFMDTHHHLSANYKSDLGEVRQFIWGHWDGN